jgi:hypothetical protein
MVGAASFFRRSASLNRGGESEPSMESAAAGGRTTIFAEGQQAAGTFGARSRH